MSTNSTRTPQIELAHELTERTDLNKHACRKIANDAEKVSKTEKYCNLLRAEIDALPDNLNTENKALAAAQEEFMFITSGNLKTTMQILLGSELTEDPNREQLKAETRMTFQELGSSTFDDPDTWISTEHESLKG